MTETGDRITEEAIGWTIRLRDAEAGDWKAFTHWLEADPAHLRAYEEVAALDHDLELLKRARRPAVPQPKLTSARPTRRQLLGWTSAAAAAALVVIGSGILLDRQSIYAIHTEGGERRVIALEDGSTIMLNGASRLLLDRDEPRFARLERGEAMFNIVHDPAARFRAEAGDATIRNIGTAFNVVHEADLVTVAVAEGAVHYRKGDVEVNLSEGDTLRQRDGRVVLGQLEPSEIGSWRRGRLSYSSATIAEIAADLSRNTGFSVRASPEVADRRFSGVIELTSDETQLLRRVAGLLSVRIRRSGDVWVLAERPG